MASSPHFANRNYKNTANVSLSSKQPPRYHRQLPPTPSTLIETSSVDADEHAFSPRKQQQQQRTTTDRLRTESISVPYQFHRSKEFQPVHQRSFDCQQHSSYFQNNDATMLAAHLPTQHKQMLQQQQVVRRSDPAVRLAVDETTATINVLPSDEKSLSLGAELIEWKRRFTTSGRRQIFKWNGRKIFEGQHETQAVINHERLAVTFNVLIVSTGWHSMGQAESSSNSAGLASIAISKRSTTPLQKLQRQPPSIVHFSTSCSFEDYSIDPPVTASQRDEDASSFNALTSPKVQPKKKYSDGLPPPPNALMFNIKGSSSLRVKPQRGDSALSEGSDMGSQTSNNTFSSHSLNNLTTYDVSETKKTKPKAASANSSAGGAKKPLRSKPNGSTESSNNAGRKQRLKNCAASGTSSNAANSTSPTTSNYNPINSAACSQQSVSKQTISAPSQQIIAYCVENVRGDIAGRVLSRMANKRDDFARFCNNLNPLQWTQFCAQFRDFLAEVFRSLHAIDNICRLSMEFGASQVQRRAFGFKADFFATMANALTTECVFLDGAAHPPTEAIEAWAELISLMFSHIRDGYYKQVRQMRKCIQRNQRDGSGGNNTLAGLSAPFLALKTSPQPTNSRNPSSELSTSTEAEPPAAPGRPRTPINLNPNPGGIMLAGQGNFSILKKAASCRE